MENSNKKKILIVEDEATLQKALGEIFLHEDYEVFSALDGARGLELAKSKKPDLILLDLILPKLDGFGVLNELKNKEETKNIPVIILTNLGETTDVQKAIELGATTYLVKSDYQLDEVVKKVEDILQP